jgi:hypothetical protein
MHRTRSIAGASLLALVLTLPFASAAAADCKEVLAIASTAWIQESQAEVGEVRGLINGSIFLTHDDEGTARANGTAPNLVIVTQEGELRASVSGTSDQREDGSWVRHLVTDSAAGTGGWDDHFIYFELDGTFVAGRGGNYQLSGKICPPGEFTPILPSDE